MIAGRVSIFATVPVLSDVIHKVMTTEAATVSGRGRAGIVGYLERHPELVRQLTHFPRAMADLQALPINLLPVELPILDAATRISSRYGLLTNDATIVALMQRHGLSDLATNDDDFDVVPGLTLWKPR